MNNNKHIIIIGAGISGLTAAYFLKKSGWNVTILEADADVGGTMKTAVIDGFMIESGPNSALETTPLFKQMVNELGIADEMLYASASSNKRYILKNGQPGKCRQSPPAFLKQITC